MFGHVIRGVRGSVFYWALRLAAGLPACGGSMKTFRFCMSVLLCFCATAWGQQIPEYDLGGASDPKPDLSFKKEKQYKRVHQSSLRLILRGELDKTETFLNQYLSDHAGDAETLYMLGILQGQRGNIKDGETFLQRAVDAGLPDGRLVAGPREVMKPFAETSLLKSVFTKYETMPVHGPLVGSVTDSSASFWVRASRETSVAVAVRKFQPTAAAGGRLPKISKSKKMAATAADDFTAVATVGGLEAGTEYEYSVFIDGRPGGWKDTQRFRTFSEDGKPTQFKIAFGGGAGYVPENERMWNTIGSFDPDAILLLGDNVYIDDPESVAMQQYTYQRRQSRPEWRKLTACSPVFTIWDDHDFSTNDSWGGADIGVPFWKKDWVFPIFRQNWANPGYAGGNRQPGCWYSFNIGDVDFIMLDCRYYRTAPQGNDRSMLGPVQKAWLKEQLTASKGTFKILCSSVPWDFRTKGDSKDTWNGYKKEHEEILSFIESEDIEGVVLMSADRHRSDAWKIERKDGYGLYEFNSSRLTNQHIHKTMEKQGAIFSYNDPQSFGLVTFDTTVADPQVTYDVVNIDGEKPHSLTVKRSELNHP